MKVTVSEDSRPKRNKTQELGTGFAKKNSMIDINIRSWTSEISEIDWDSLVHAYGSALDIPLHLKRIISGNYQSNLQLIPKGSPSDRKNAMQELYNSVLNQGTIYSSTTYVVELLQLLLTYPVSNHFSS
jgi:hypothetical protein